MMVRLLCGDNEFAVLAEKERLVLEFLENNDQFGLERIDGSTVSTDILKDALLQLPFLADKKLVVISRPFESKNAIELIDRCLEQVPDSIDVVLVDPRPDRRTRLYKSLAQKKWVETFDSLNGLALSRWVSDYAKACGSQIDKAGIEVLLSRVGPNQMMLAREIEKLSAYDQINQTLIEEAVDKRLESTVFELLDATFQKDRYKALRIFDELLSIGTDPSEIIGLFSWQLSVFAACVYSRSKQASEIAKKYRIHPFVAGKALNATKALSKNQLKEIITLTINADLKIKTSGTNSKDELKVLILGIASLE